MSMRVPSIHYYHLYMNKSFASYLFQGQGLGSKLFDFGESLAPISMVDVLSICDNLFPFYEKRGYVVTSRDPVDKHIPAHLLTRTDLEMVTLTKTKSLTK